MRVTYMTSVNHTLAPNATVLLHAYTFAPNPRKPAQTLAFAHKTSRKFGLDEVLLTVLVGLLCRMEDFDEIAMFGEGQLSWLRRFLPFRHGVAPAQTLRRVLRAPDPKALERAFSSWVASLQAKVLRRGDRRQDPARDEAGQERRRCLACCFGLCA